MNNLSNLDSYSDVENLDRFDEDGFNNYCEMKLKSCRNNVEFIKQYCWGGKPLKVCEIGSGNSKLLYALEKEGILEEGIGYEVSKSRWKFAERFKKYMSSTKVTNINQNVLEVEIDQKFDLIICVDIVSQIIAPLSDTAEYDYFHWIRNHLSQNGACYMEFIDYSYEKDMINKEHRAHAWWEEFPEQDPFQYGLYRVTLDKDDNLVYDKKFYEKKTRSFQTFQNVIKSYTPEDVCKLLVEYQMVGTHFSVEQLFSESEAGELEKGVFWIVARRQD